MNFATFERAQVAAFAYREAHASGSFDAMRAICFVLRNRVKAGWGDGTWLSILESAGIVSADDYKTSEVLEAASGGQGLSSDRLLQMMVRDIDDIYLGQERLDDNVRRVVCGDDPKEKRYALYYCFANRTPRPWFTDNIIRQAGDHAQIGTVGTMLLFR